MDRNIFKGWVIFGFYRCKESQNDSRNFLSKSLLLEKSNFGFKKKSEEVIPPEEDFDLSTT